MNERIRELAKQAGFDWALKRSSLYGHDDDKQNLEKFAELIIRECAGIAHGSDRPSKDIKDHFGFEE